MNNWWFTADQHFGHGNIIKHCNRPFQDVRDMDIALTEAWNRVVKPRDNVVVLGDFFWDINYDVVTRYAREILQGNVILVKGNHDYWFKKNKRYMYNKKIKPVHVWGCHYPLASWPSGIMLHGHCHGNMPEIPNRFDVGVDCHPDYEPFNLDEITSWIDWDLLDRKNREGREEFPDHGV